LLQLSHKKLDAWKYSILLIVEVRKIVLHFPDDEKYVLTSQIRRAALSISNNIAEGAARKTNAEKRRFFEISRSSLVEVDNCIEVALALQYISNINIEILITYMETIFKTLTGLINKNTL
jgi:four helix bundle protein